MNFKIENMKNVRSYTKRAMDRWMKSNLYVLSLDCGIDTLKRAMLEVKYRVLDSVPNPFDSDPGFYSRIGKS